MVSKDFNRFNAQIKDWAERQPKKYRNALKAIGYRCDTETLTTTMKLKDMQWHSRRNGYDVSVRTLKTYIPVFEACGMVTVERHRGPDRNAPSTYTLNLAEDIHEIPCPDHMYLRSLPGECPECKVKKAGNDQW